MKTMHRMVAPLALLLSLAATAGAADDKLAASLRVVAEENVRAYEAEDVDGVLRTMHTRSPEYDPTRAALPEQFKEQDLTVKLVDFRYMGHDDEFAIARVKTMVAGTPGSGFQDNVTDSVLLFHREGGLWKLWSDEVLGVNFEQKVGTVTPNYPTPQAR
jgi:hypothetical protein